MDQSHTVTTDRLQWVDTAKSLGLLLVIWGHLLYGGTWGRVNRAIYSFHMPLYFVLSGLTGSCVFIYISNILAHVSYIRDYAKWTIFIVSSHYIFVTIFRHIANHIGFEYTFLYDVLSLVYTLAILWLYRYASIFVDKYVPLLNGKRKL